MCHRKLVQFSLYQIQNLIAVMPEKQKSLELDGSIGIDVLWEGTSLRGCRVNPVLNSPAEYRRKEDVETAASPSLLALCKSSVTETLLLL